MSKSDFIYCEKGAYSKESCDSIIRYFEDNKEHARSGIMGANGTLDNLELCIDLKHHGLEKYINKGMSNYVKVYPLLNTHISRWGPWRTCQLMKYEPNQYYDRMHCENDGTSRMEIITRGFAWMIYLNTIRRGGGTEFIHQKVTAKPRAGDLYIWPAGWTHMHRGINAPHEVKYILTGWCNYNPNFNHS